MRTGALLVVCILLSAGCLASIAFAQTNWARTYGGDQGYSVQQTSDGGYIIAGWTSHSGAGGADVYLIKTNAQGDTLWTRTYGGPGDDKGYSVQQTTDGGYIIAGYTSSFGAGREDVYLIKTNAQGDTLWTRTYGGHLRDTGSCVQQTTDGGFVIAGYTWSFGAGSEDVYLIKTNAQGDTLWTRTYGGTRGDEGNSVAQTTDGGYIVAGLTHSFGPGTPVYSNVYLVKTNASGDTLWTRTYGGMGGDWGSSVQQTNDGGYIITGIAGYSDTARPDVYLIKTDAQGDTIWTRTYGGPSYDFGYSVQQTTDGGYVIVGYTDSFNPWSPDFGEVYLIKTNAQGDTLWTRTYGEPGGLGYSVQQTRDSSYVIAGDAGSTGYGGVYLIKTNGELDAGPESILSPPGIADSGSMYMPGAVVRNYGLNSGSILQVTMDIGSGYSQTMQETLMSVPQDTIVFPEWTAGPVGLVPVTCYTSMAGDMHPANDTIRDTIQVVGPPRHDVGASAILAPPSVLRAGDTVMPKVRIKNFGNTAERLFDVQFRISTGYSRTVTVTQALSPDSTMDLTFSECVAPPGQWAVSCSTMLANDVNRANDKVSSSVQTFPQSLQIGPDQSDQLQAGQGRTYRFYALVQGDTGGVVEVARPPAPPGWSLRLCNATGANDLIDTDGDGIPDLGYVAPGESCWFSLDVTASAGLVGDTASLAQRAFLIAGHLGNDSLVADTAVLNLTLMPGFSVHNFPNPFSASTSFVIGLPEDGKVSLTIYTRAGERVCRLMTNSQVPMTNMAAGVHIVPWDGTNDNGRHVAPGTYEYVLDYEHAGKTDRIHKRLVLTGQ